MATYIEVQQQIAELQKQAEALKAAERKGVIERMKEAISVYDITPTDLGFGTGRRAAAKPAKRAARSTKNKGFASVPYGDEKGNTWGGRGPRPRWLKEALAAGAKLEDFAR